MMILARAVAFEGALGSSRNLLDRMASGPDGAMINVATDGETFGHHFPFGERCIAHALEVESRGRDLEIINYGEYLERHPALDEVEIKPGEGTAWSCVHGVGRWYRNCGCQNGGPDGWHQAWRGPLRWAFDLLRDHAARSLEEVGGALFRDPWKARDEYIDVALRTIRYRAPAPGRVRIEYQRGRRFDAALHNEISYLERRSSLRRD